MLGAPTFIEPAPVDRDGVLVLPFQRKDDDGGPLDPQAYDRAFDAYREAVRVAEHADSPVDVDVHAAALNRALDAAAPAIEFAALHQLYQRLLSLAEQTNRGRADGFETGLRVAAVQALNLARELSGAGDAA